MNKKHRVSLSASIIITEHEILKESEKSVWFKNKYFNGKSREIRELKASSYSRWFDTLDDARDFVFNRLNKSVKTCARRYEKAQNELLYFLKETGYQEEIKPF